MKKVIIILAILFTVKQSFSQEFLGIKVGGSRKECVDKFLAKGFKVAAPPTDNVISLTGKVNNESIELIIVNTPTSKKVWKFAVYLPKKTSWNDLKSSYNYYLELLRTKYGEPNNVYDNFVSPYYEGDGYEMSAVRLDKVNFSAFWDDIYIEISEYEQVAIHYQNTENSLLNREEKDKLNLKTF